MLRSIERALAGFIGLISFLNGYTAILFLVVILEYLTMPKDKAKSSK